MQKSENNNATKAVKPKASSLTAEKSKKTATTKAKISQAASKTASKAEVKAKAKPTTAAKPDKVRTSAKPDKAKTTAAKPNTAKTAAKRTTKAAPKTQKSGRVKLKIRDYDTTKSFESQVQSINVATEVAQKPLDIGNIIINTFLYTMIALLGLVMWFVSVVYVVEPKASIKYFDFLRAPKASLAAYERAYNLSHENYDLYDLINKSIETGSYKTTIKYINELRTQTYYQAFVDEIDVTSTEGIAKRYVALVGDYDGYLNSQYVIALYKTGQKDAAIKAAADDLSNANYRSFALSAYFDCLYSDKTLTTYIADILQVKAYTCKDGRTLIENLEDRRTTVDITNSHDLDDINERLVRLYTSMKIDNVLYDIYKYSGEVGLADEVAAEYRALRDIYDSLV